MKVKWKEAKPLTTDPPPAREPRAITAATNTHGHRLVTVVDDGYRREIRSVGNPYWMHVATSRHWERNEEPPADIDPADRDVVLVVDGCNEAAWYAWKREGESAYPRTFPLTAALTWIE